MVAKAIRDFLAGEGFLEIETPMLSRSTPEGARDFLVPSRREPGTFYALPQSPQLFKQLLMVAGFERYFQIVRCFRDEDQRADRQPDFTQLDLEMSFVGVEDVLDLNERLLAAVFERGRRAGARAAAAADRLRRRDRALRHRPAGPALRARAGRAHRPARRDRVQGLSRRRSRRAGWSRGSTPAPARSRASALDGFIARAQELGAKGLVWAFREGEGWRSPTAKFLSAEELAALNERFDAAEGDLLLVVADEPAIANSVLAQLRLDLAERFELIDPEAEEFCWITDWPMFEWNESEQRWDPLHHPFTAPDGRARPRATRARRGRSPTTSSGTARSSAAARSGSPTRSCSSGCSRRSGSTPSEARERFGFLLEALRYGAPPHGGIAYGLDRLDAAARSHADSIRDVIAFPKAASGADPLTGAPAAGRRGAAARARARSVRKR